MMNFFSASCALLQCDLLAMYAWLIASCFFFLSVHVLNELFAFQL